MMGNGTMNGFLLSTLIWLPILGAVAVMLAGEQRPLMAKGLAFLIAVAGVGWWFVKPSPAPPPG